MLYSLPDAPLDIVGDIHGELPALQSLLHHLGYDQNGRHPQGRRLVFVGDFCDRGPDSPGVIALVRRIVEEGLGFAVIGNHELNLLRGDRKVGNDWFWDEGRARDHVYRPFRLQPAAERQGVLDFFAALPLALEREDLRVVHAVWHSEALSQVQAASGKAYYPLFDAWEQALEHRLQAEGIAAESEHEQAQWGHSLEDPSLTPPFMPATARRDELLQMGNPLRVLTSGVERVAPDPFYSNGQWRFVERVGWWDDYHEETPVVIGHYWRRMNAPDEQLAGKGGPKLFAGVGPTQWHGARNTVFCVDFSVGGRFLERQHGRPLGSATQLAALRWPERTLMCEDGTETVTEAFADL